MKRFIPVLTACLLIAFAPLLSAQLAGGGLGGSPSGPGVSGEMLKLFGEHQAFTAAVEFQVTPSGQDTPLTLPGQLALLDGRTRFEMDLSDATGEQIPPQALAQLKQMGMEKLVTITLPTEEKSYLIYPGLESYVALPITDPDAKKSAADFEMNVTEVAKEDVDGQACTKNRVVVTDTEGNRHESTVWNATDLKNFPVKIQTNEEGHDIVMRFSNVKLAKPAADRFAPPTSYKQYDTMMGMMQEVMTKRMGAGTTNPARP